MCASGHQRSTNIEFSNRLAELNYSSGGVVDRYESIYAVLARFAIVNTLSKQKLMDLFKAKTLAGWGLPGGLSNVGFFDKEQVKCLTRVSNLQLNEMFLTWRPGLRVPVSCMYFRYCSICVSAHRHYTVFQNELIGRCPFHFIQLRTNCTCCGATVEYNWHSKLLSHPFRCAHCGEPLGIRHGNVVFFDLHSLARSNRIAWASGDKTAVRPLSIGANEECPGYVVCGSSGGDFNQWRAMATLPLYGRDWSDRNWSVCAGYVQVRGARVRSLRNQCAVDAVSSHCEIATTMVQCLKSILRNLRKRWHLGRSVSVLGGIQWHREQAYRMLLRHWYGIYSQSYGRVGRREREHLISVINRWLRDCVNRADAYAVPLSVTAWFCTHQFCDWVVESIETIARMIDRPSSIPDACVLEQIQHPRKSLWLVALIEPQSYISYRVLQYQHYSSCLSSEEVWFGSSDQD